MKPRDALAMALQDDKSTLRWALRNGRPNAAFWEQEAERLLAALPATVHLVVHEHDIEDVFGCRECSDALEAGRALPEGQS